LTIFIFAVFDVSSDFLGTKFKLINVLH
jgi:hypothetical protein